MQKNLLSLNLKIKYLNKPEGASLVDEAQEEAQDDPMKYPAGAY